jgi:D-lactate dehydrogenase
MVGELRAAQHGPRAEALALRAAKRWRAVEWAARAGLRFGGLPARRTKRGSALPPAAPRLPTTSREGAAAVYLPSCTTRIFGPYGTKSQQQALVDVSARAGLPLWIPDDVGGSCCGLPFGSKGFVEAHRRKANEMVERLWAWSGEGELAVVVDAASCTQALAAPGEGVLDGRNAERQVALEILDSVVWAHDRLLPHLEVSGRVGSATVHPTCAARQMGLAPRLRSLAAALAEDVHVAPSATCCGFAGDRGISHPELTAAATADQAAELAGRRFDAHLCSNRTCEIGLTRATGRPYESFLLLLDELTRAR